MSQWPLRKPLTCNAGGGRWWLRNHQPIRSHHNIQRPLWKGGPQIRIGDRCTRVRREIPVRKRCVRQTRDRLFSRRVARRSDRCQRRRRQCVSDPASCTPSAHIRKYPHQNLHSYNSQYFLIVLVYSLHISVYFVFSFVYNATAYRKNAVKLYGSIVAGGNRLFFNEETYRR